MLYFWENPKKSFKNKVQHKIQKWCLSWLYFVCFRTMKGENNRWYIVWPLIKRENRLFRIWHIFVSSIMTLVNFFSFDTNCRQIDITTYQIRKIKADTSLCLFADEMFTRAVLYFTVFKITLDIGLLFVWETILTQFKIFKTKNMTKNKKTKKPSLANWTRSFK